MGKSLPTIIVFAFGAIFSCHGTVAAKDWRGLVPLHSTKADVVRLFPQCSSSDSYCAFRLKKQDVFIVYSSNLAHSHEGCGERLPTNTVLSITITPSSGQGVEGLRLSEPQYRKIGPTLWGYIYVNETEGVVIRAKSGKVVQISYVPGSAERSLCSVYYGNLEEFASLDPNLPSLEVTCPKTRIEPGDTIQFSASSVYNPKISFSWTVSVGRIVTGQYTDQISVATEGFDGEKIIATVEMRILGDRHIQAASCEAKINQKRN